MKIVSLFNEQVNFLFGVVPFRENFVNITFPFSRFCFALPDDFFFNECHEDVGKRDCHFGTHSGAMGLEKIVSTELERIFLEYEEKSMSKRGRLLTLIIHHNATRIDFLN